MCMLLCSLQIAQSSGIAQYQLIPSFLSLRSDSMFSPLKWLTLFYIIRLSMDKFLGCSYHCIIECVYLQDQFLQLKLLSSRECALEIQISAIKLLSQVPVTTVYPALCQSELHSGRKELTSNCINPGPQSTDCSGSLGLSKHAIFCLLRLWWENSCAQTELRVGTRVLGHHKCKAPECLAAWPQHVCIPHAREGVRKVTDIGSSLVF